MTTERDHLACPHGRPDNVRCSICAGDTGEWWPQVCGVTNVETGVRCLLTEEDHGLGHVWQIPAPVVRTPPGSRSGGDGA